MTFIRGPMLDLPWSKSGDFTKETSTSSARVGNPIKGKCTKLTYHGAVSDNFDMLDGCNEGSVWALIFEHDSSDWVIRLDYALIVVVYGVRDGTSTHDTSTFDQNLYCTGMKYTTTTFIVDMSNIVPAFVFILAWIFRIIVGIVIVIGLYSVLSTFDQNLYCMGMEYTTTFIVDMSNIVPTFVFILAWIFRFETVIIRKIHSPAKILGTIVTGAMIMTFIRGPMWDLPSSKSGDFTKESSTSSTRVGNPIKGALMIIAIALNLYPTELSLTVLICLIGAIEGSVWALIFEYDSLAWVIRLDYVLIADFYGGVICSGIAYCFQSVIRKSKPVFVIDFNPLIMVIVAITRSFLLSKIIYLGWIIGGIVIVIELYSVLWGKCKDESTPL
ncbi:hypothetical protein Ddye_010100 [Dipteronia dyeriana]|uniref:EamA domain-containing protein n=1 Tax=Dipteronia dyeriana TaxID=168575 RepID=A0AAD9XCY2_9ROSI|nr:hypothetical protein Ddye_010100 [Dipteronia dyeriana]